MASTTIPARAVGHVRDALHREFDAHIDLSDLDSRPAGERQQSFRSRALAALLVRTLTGCDSATAAASVIDGRNDGGIDAVTVVPATARILLVQSKWSDSGTASFPVADALKLFEGLRKIDQQEFSWFNDRFQRHAEPIRAALRDPRLQITLVLALMRSEVLAVDVIKRLEDVKAEFNSYTPILDYQVWTAPDIWQIIRDEIDEPPISLTAKMQYWIHLAEPYEAYYGTVPVAEVSGWYEAHGDRLFEKNIRKSLGLTQVNAGITGTLAQEAQDFWYRNNGITVLCDKVERTEWSRTSAGPVELLLDGASVVNGAQTVAATHDAMQQTPDRAERGFVGVRIISTKGCPDGFADEITKATNTQNRVDRRDFAALDSIQSEIRDDFRLSLGKTYVLKRGDMDPPPDEGCSMVHAAMALACAHHNAGLAARAKRDPDLLWEEGSQGAYELLFAHRPSAVQIWRSVLLLRSVRAALAEARREWEGRAAAIAEQGDFLVAHIVFQHIGMNKIDDPDADWEAAVFSRVPGATANALGWLIRHVDATYGPTSYITSTFTNAQRCRELDHRVLASLRGVSEPVPEPPPEYRKPPRRPRRARRLIAVHALIDAGRIPEGATLVFQPKTERERKALARWLAADERRSRATWVYDRSQPLLWAADGALYSPSGLVTHMWRLAEWEESPVAVQGTAQWFVPGEGSLVQLADAVLSE